MPWHRVLTTETSSWLALLKAVL